MTGQIGQPMVLALTLILAAGFGWILRSYIGVLLRWLDLRLIPARHLKECGVRKRVQPGKLSSDDK